MNPSNVGLGWGDRGSDAPPVGGGVNAVSSVPGVSALMAADEAAGVLIVAPTTGGNGSARPAAAGATTGELVTTSPDRDAFEGGAD